MSLLQRNVALGSPQPLSSWRKISFGSWRPTGDSSIHAAIEIDAEPALSFLPSLNQQCPEGTAKVTFVHLFAKALGIAIARNPQINSLIRFGRLYQRKSVDVFMHVVRDFDNPEDLSGVVIRDVDQMSLTNIAAETAEQVKKFRATARDPLGAVKGAFRVVPGFLCPLVLDLLGFILYSMNLWSPCFGSPRDTFGSVMLTNIGSFGGDNAFAPIAPYTRTPMVVALGAVKKRPFVINNEVVARQTVRVGFVYDHRICDGIHAQRLFNDLQRLLGEELPALALR